MSNLCSLPWCRKPITNRRKSKNFPLDRPSQLAWLDALDAGTWFSIPPETLSTGLILCECHFDSKGNVIRRYELPQTSHDPEIVKTEPGDIISDESENEDREMDNASDNSNYCAEDSSESIRKQKGRNVKEVRINIVSYGKGKRKVKHNEQNSSKKTRKQTKKISYVESGSGDEGDNNHRGDFETEEGDIEHESEITSDSFERSAISKNTKGNEDDDGKRQSRQSVTLMEKMEVIRMLDNGMKQSQISKKMKIPKSTIGNIINRRNIIEEAYRSGAPLRKRIVRREQFADVNEALYQWYEKVRTQNLFVNSRVMLTMAENIANELGRKDFSPTPKWLQRFKDRYNIRFTSTPAKPRKKLNTMAAKKLKNETDEGGDETGEELDGNENEMDEGNKKITKEDEDSWLKRDWLRNTWAECRIRNLKTREPYPERDIFFVEELGILYRITPKQAWQFKTGKNLDSAMKNFSITEERLTVLLCSNADGSEKIKLLICGSESQLRGVVIPCNLPADFITTTDPSNWIIKSAFARWISKWNRQLQSENRKIVLLSNSSPIHRFSEDKFSNIKILNIPTRLLSSLHPVNFGIATNFKSRYRRLLLEKLVNAEEGGKGVTCLEAIFMLCTAWNELPPELMRAAFLKAGYFSSNDVTNVPEDSFDVSSLITKATELDLAVPLSRYRFSEYVEIDNSLCAIECTVLGSGSTETDEPDYVDNVQDNDEVNNDSIDHYVGARVQCDLTASDARSALETLRLYAMSRSSCPQPVHNALSTLESFLLGHHN